ncbi:MAG: hypothetical protein JWM11_3285 [Planctomycetaceae bacterium]|nr:hypothetical protein [Planctomycetaceae bacterium]
MRMGLQIRRWAGTASTWISGAHRPRKRKRPNWDYLTSEPLEQRCVLTVSQGWASVLQPDGKEIVGGSALDPATGNSDFAISRLNPDGTPDTTFNGDGQVLVPFNLLGAAGGEDAATCVSLQADGKIVVGGSAQASLNGDYDFAVARINFDGTLDTSFGNGGKTTIGFQAGGNLEDRATGIGVAQDGKIVVGGWATRNASGNTDFAVARLTTSGSVDPTFNSTGKKLIAFDVGGARTDKASSLAVQPDGRIVLAGSAQISKRGDYDFAVVRLNTNGSADKSFAGTGKRTVSFNLGGNRSDEATSVALQGTNIVLGGYATRDSSGNEDFAAVRLLSNGNLDRSFSGDGKQTAAFDLGGSLQDRATSIAPTPDGRLVLAGLSEISDGGDYDYGVVRLTPNGSLDPSFGNNGSVVVPIDLTGDARDEAHAVTVNPEDDSITVAGTAYSGDAGDSEVAVARLTWLGNLDTLFAQNGLATYSFDNPNPPV